MIQDPVDWSKLPIPIDDGRASHLEGAELPSIELRATDGRAVDLSQLAGMAIVYAYPLTTKPGTPAPDDWDVIPGARGCTPQSCSFRDHFVEFDELEVGHIFGLSTQDTPYQQEAVSRLHLPFALLSDESLQLAMALRLPTFEVSGMTLLSRLTMVIPKGRILKVFYPVFPPDRSASDVANWLRSHQA
ncbi:peroxiredoxin [Bosea psychrotolerans]|uniref:Peroxiredoxin (Alkyl hydroperoxide reductase subunit C) n=1 Tax=Bosea psychrotolerans TaxID=1871628 RepID=A0A2S4M7W6_9HYPH|nr:peroxiredoxin [Bosea psychrotolerans]POR50830.1 peroxiredoxin (alkyl hydroperoxide reductase subunit C) [Bosea psychrotolerans]